MNSTVLQHCTYGQRQWASSVQSLVQWDVTVWTANNCEIRHVAVLGRLAVVVPRPTQPSVSPRSVNENQLWLARQRQIWFIPFVDKRVAGKTVWSLDNACHISALLRWDSHEEALYQMSVTSTFTFTIDDVSFSKSWDCRHCLGTTTVYKRCVCMVYFVHWVMLVWCVFLGLQGGAAVKQGSLSRRRGPSTAETASCLLRQTTSVSGPENIVMSSRRPKCVLFLLGILPIDF